MHAWLHVLLSLTNLFGISREETYSSDVICNPEKICISVDFHYGCGLHLSTNCEHMGNVSFTTSGSTYSLRSSERISVVGQKVTLSI